MKLLRTHGGVFFCFALTPNPQTMIFKRFSLMVLMSVSLTTVFAQYRSALGVIGGKEGFGLTYKQFIQPEQNIEINFLYSRITGTAQDGGVLIALYQLHKEIHASTLHTTNLSWSVGGGLHAGYWNDFSVSNGYAAANTAFGIDAVLGLEYQLGFVPITLGAQVRPNYEFVHTESAPQRYFDMAVMVRYIIAD